MSERSERIGRHGATARGTVPDEAFAAALAGFRGMTLARLSTLLRCHAPREAFAVAAGDAPPAGLAARVLADADVTRCWRAEATRRSPAQVWEQCVAAGISVLVRDTPGYPPILADDPLPPPVLFVRGSMELIDGRRVGVVGTRNATAAGRDVAMRLGRQLAEAGVHVVSGLARGIDGAAHRGTLAAGGEGRAIAVVASGPDVVYPREHRALWERIAAEGLLMSESPPGTAPEAYRFPLRNRIIAAVSELVVVVESRERGGSLITVDAAIERGVAVMAVPGGVHNPAAVGTNALLRDGAGAVVDAGDVLLALSIEHRPTSPAPGEVRARPQRGDLDVYRACLAAPSTVDRLVLATGGSLVEVAMALARLEQQGWVAQADGWFEALGTPFR